MFKYSPDQTAFCVYYLSSYLIDYKYLSKLIERYRI